MRRDGYEDSNGLSTLKACLEQKRMEMGICSSGHVWFISFEISTNQVATLTLLYPLRVSLLQNLGAR